MKKIGTVNKTREILEKNGFMMKMKFGQNFLIDQNILSSIVTKAEINKNVNVIEIGPGIGSLTEHLLENANKVISYEIDNTLIPILTEEFKDYDNFTLLNQDILKANIKDDYAATEPSDVIELSEKESTDKAISDTDVSDNDDIIDF